MMDRSCPPGSADVHVGSLFSPISRLKVLKPNAKTHPPSRSTTSRAAARGAEAPARGQRSEVGGQHQSASRELLAIYPLRHVAAISIANAKRTL